MKNSLLKMSSSLKIDLIFLLLITLFSIVSQTVLLKPHLEYGFAPDDLWLLAQYRLFVVHAFTHFMADWGRFGPYFTSPVYYIGILSEFFGNNFYLYQLTSHIFKILSVVSLYLLVLVVFKNRVISFFSAVVFGLHYSAISSLEMVVRNMDYLAITLTNLFLIYYYYLTRRTLVGIKWIILGMFLLLLSFSINPIRMYPLPIFIFFIELGLLFSKRAYFKDVIYRLIFFLGPFLLAFFLNLQIVLLSILPGPSAISEYVYHGNWHLILTPYTALGSMFLPSVIWEARLNIPLLSIYDFFKAILIELFPILFVVSLFFSFFFSKKTIFLLRVLLLTLISYGLCYFAFTSWQSITGIYKINYAFRNIIPTFIGVYVLVLTVLLFIEGVKKNNGLIIKSCIALFFSFIFIFSTWILQDYRNAFLNISGYLTIPSEGASVFLGSVIVLLINEIKGKGALTKGLTVIGILIYMVIFLMGSFVEINNYFTSNLDFGMRGSEQVELVKKFKAVTSDRKLGEETLIYFDGSETYKDGRFYTVNIIDRPIHWFLFNYPDMDGECSTPSVITQEKKELLINNYQSRGGRKGFKLGVVCENFVIKAKHSDFFDARNFYAFKLKNRGFVDITREFLSDLESR